MLGKHNEKSNVLHFYELIYYFEREGLEHLVLRLCEFLDDIILRSRGGEGHLLLCSVLTGVSLIRLIALLTILARIVALISFALCKIVLCKVLF